MNILGFLYDIFGYIIRFIYELVNNYGVTIILFTIIIKVLMLPLSIKQVKSTSKMQLLQPEIAKIQEKYKNDKEKLQQEQMKLYQKYKINPASGCLPLLIQLPIIMGLYYVITQPLTYILRFSAEQIDALKTILYAGANAPNYQITIAQDMLTKWNDVSTNPLFTSVKPMDFSFLGINLSQTPSLSYINWLWLFPILVYVTTYYSGKIGMVQQKKAASGDGSAAQMAKTSDTMMKVMPLMTLFFAVTMPTGVSLYWIVSSLFQMVQQYYLNKRYVHKNLEEGFVEQVEADLEAEKKVKKNRGRKK